MNKIEVDFSLALNNRTGKFFIGRDLIANLGDSISRVRYWRVTRSAPPSGLHARVLGRLMMWEIGARLRQNFLARLVPKTNTPNPVVFTDALQVLLYKLKPQDTVIVYDMGPITHPQFYAHRVSSIYQQIFREIASVSPRLIFISDSSLMEYERLYGKAYAFAKVVYPELRLEVREGHSEPVPGAKPPFLLTVGAIGDRKNQLAVIEAFEKAGLPERGYSYVICGGPEPGFEKVHSRAQGLPWVLLTGYVSDSQLRWLYANATGFLLPSLLEGFGIPAAEAIVRDLVPLVGRGGALHEVTGNSAVLVDPSDVDSIAAGINEILSLSAQQKAAKLANLRERLKFFAPSDAWKNAILATPANNLVSSHAPFEILA